MLCNGLGGYALRTGNARYIIDQCALTDVFLARLPMKTSDDFRIGHLERSISKDYLKSREKDKNVFNNDALFDLFSDVDLVTMGNVFSTERFQAIRRLNGGMVSYSLDFSMIRSQRDRVESRNLINSQFKGEK